MVFLCQITCKYKTFLIFFKSREPPLSTSMTRQLIDREVEMPEILRLFVNSF